MSDDPFVAHSKKTMSWMRRRRTRTDEVPLVFRTVALILLCAWLASGCTQQPGSTTAAKPKKARVGSGNPEITASPNPIPAGPGNGKTIVSWNAGEGKTGEVYVVSPDGTERLFAGNSGIGEKEAPFINAKREFEFRLYEGKQHETLLGSVKVTREKRKK
jgi:hypothetical protein